MMANPEVVEHLRGRLLSAANRTGWGYSAGKASRVESTCWALLALGGTHDSSSGDWASFARQHTAFLASVQGGDGLLTETEPALANVTANALAAIALAGPVPQPSDGILSRLLEALASIKGVKLPEADPRQDNSLQGWPWVRNTFSWVEPTSWCLLALKRAGKGTRGKVGAARQEEAERLLRNRMCVGGGWNYGNASAVGQDLRAYVPTTAVALMALQDRRTDPMVSESLAMITRERLSELGTMSLGLTSICLKLFDVPADDVNERLVETVSRSGSDPNVLATAIATVALSADRHQLEAFRV
jgi:hypothetical protein